MNHRKGFTLVEALIVMVLFTLLIVKVVMLLQMQQENHSRASVMIAVEDTARRVMDQIGYAVMGAARDTLVPDAEVPIYSTELRYEVSLGIVDGEVVWDAPEWVGLTASEGQLAWKERPDEPDERRVVWCNAVRPFLGGEVVNGIDDNGNGLVDEKGLAFAIDGRKVTVRLTLERKDSHGRPISSTVETIVVCRN